MKKNFKEMTKVEELELVEEVLKRMGVDFSKVTVAQAFAIFRDIKDSVALALFI